MERYAKVKRRYPTSTFTKANLNTASDRAKVRADGRTVRFIPETGKTMCDMEEA
jgi:hypothetical protein